MKFYVGVDIGGMSIKVGIVDENGKIFASSSFVTNIQDSVSAIVKKILNKIEKLKKPDDVCLGIGIGIPGVTDSNTGIVRSAVNIGWSNVNLIEEFKKQTDIKVGILNDANAAVLGEYKFTDISKEYTDIVMITLGTGIGGGIIIDGELYQGKTFAAGEIGHIPIQKEGLKCNCGGVGCFEQYASASALIRITKECIAANKKSILSEQSIMDGCVNGKTAFIAEKQGCPYAHEVIEEYINNVATGLIAISNFIHPECIIIGGGISKEGDAFVSRLQEKVDYYVDSSGFGPKVLIRRAKLTNDAGIIGAAGFVMN